MNPLAQEACLAILRWLLTLGAGYFVSKGIWKPEDANHYVMAGSVALLTLAWSLWSKYKTEKKLDFARFVLKHNT